MDCGALTRREKDGLEGHRDVMDCGALTRREKDGLEGHRDTKGNAAAR
jgi:hypothetical protein